MTGSSAFRPTRIVGEFVLIVAGVLSALAADGWRENRIELERGREYAARLADDLRSDIELWEVSLDWIQEKRPSLHRLARLDQAGLAADPGRAALDLWMAQGWSWGSINTNDATYQEMLSAGDMNLLRDPELRADIVRHYNTREARMRSIDARRTGIGPLSYRLLLPREDRPDPGAWELDRDYPFDHTFVDPPSPAELREIRQLASAELESSEYMTSVARLLLESAGTLLERLEAYDRP